MHVVFAVVAVLGGIAVTLAALGLTISLALLRLTKGAARRVKPPIPRMKIEIVKGDITTEEVDVIVNAAKSSLLGGGGVDGAIHQAGGAAILRDCHHLRATTHPDGLKPGQAVITGAGDLPADWVVHTVGPVYDTAKDQAAILRSCYTESLALADEYGARTIAFPLISSGVYGWPKHDAVVQALTALRSADTAVGLAKLVVFDEESYRAAQYLVVLEALAAD